MATWSYGPRGLVQGAIGPLDATSSTNASPSIAAEALPSANSSSEPIRPFVCALVMMAVLLLALLSEVVVVTGVTVAFKVASKVYHEALIERYEMQKALSVADEEDATESRTGAAAAGVTAAKRSKSSGRALRNPGVRQDKLALNCMENAHGCN